jgi:DNA adenine methylase
MSPTANFTDYSADGFDREDQERLIDLVTELADAGVSVVVSNSGVTADRYLEAGLDVDLEGATRAINSDASNRDEVDEIIATTVPDEQRRGATQTGLGEFSG